MVSIPACHAGDRGSIPRRGEYFDCLNLSDFVNLSDFRIPRNRVVRNSGLPLLAPLYQPQQKDNYLDLATGRSTYWNVFFISQRQLVK